MGRNLLPGTISQEKQVLIEVQGEVRARRSELKPLCSQDGRGVSLSEVGCQLSGQWSRTGAGGRGTVRKIGRVMPQSPMSRCQWVQEAVPRGVSF